MIVSGEAIAGVFATRDATGLLAAAGVGPAGALYVDGVVTLDPVVIAGANPYSWAVTLPALATGAVVQVYITATIAGVATGAVVFTDTIGLVPAVPGDAMDLVINAVDSNALATTAADKIADHVWDEALAGHLAVGSTGEALDNAASCGMGAGAIDFIYTVTDTVTLLPIDGVQVWVSTDLAGLNVIASGYTNAFGQVTFWLDPATYYFWRTRAGYTFANPDTEVVV